MLTINAQLRYYMHVPNPDALSDEEWATLAEQLNKIRTEEAERNRLR